MNKHEHDPNLFITTQRDKEQEVFAHLSLGSVLLLGLLLDLVLFPVFVGFGLLWLDYFGGGFFGKLFLDAHSRGEFLVLWGVYFMAIEYFRLTQRRDSFWSFSLWFCPFCRLVLGRTKDKIFFTVLSLLYVLQLVHIKSISFKQSYTVSYKLLLRFFLTVPKSMGFFIIIG